MKRSVAREAALCCIFSLAFTGNRNPDALEDLLSGEALATLGEQTGLYEGVPDQAEYIRNVVTGVWEKQQELDAYIAEYASGWNLNRISRVCRAVLRLSIYEILFQEGVPASVAINEAVELTKKYAGDEMPAFVNGVLGGFVRGEKIEQ